MAWLIVPVLVFVGRVVVGRRLALVITVAAAFALLVTPWMVRNMALSGCHLALRPWLHWKARKFFLLTLWNDP